MRRMSDAGNATHSLKLSPAEDPLAILEALAEAPRFNRWMADTLSPYVAGTVLEIGAGIGNLTRLLHPLSTRYVAVDIDEHSLAHLKARLGDLPNLLVVAGDASNAADLERYRRQIDTVICLNVLEHIEDDVLALRNMYSCLRTGGRALILVPQGMGAFGTLDEVLHHCRRYARPELQGKLQAAGFRVEKLIEFNRITYPGWILNGRVLRRRGLSRLQLRLFELLVPFWRHIDSLLPWPPTSLIAVGMRDD
jgi:SAM-dependent methyltransferase